MPPNTPRFAASGPTSSNRSRTYLCDQVLTNVVMPAGHRPGLYSIWQATLCRVFASAGTVTIVVEWTHPDFGVVQHTVGAANATNQRLFTRGQVSAWSSGAGPISVIYTPAGITGSPIVDVVDFATLVSNRRTVS